MSADVFISYRRSATHDSEVRSIADAIRSGIKQRTVYMDVERHATGRGIREDIKQDLKNGSVLVVLINSSWINSIHRLNNPDDIVRLEIAVALELDLDVLPVVLSDGRLPRADELPPDISGLLNRQVTLWRDFPTPETALQTFVNVIQQTLPPLRARALTVLAESNASNFTFGLAIFGGMLLYVSSLLGIHRFFFKIEVTPKIAGITELPISISREGGVVMAWNWTLVLLLITPIMAHLALTTLKEAKSLLEDMGTRKMIYYKDLGGSNSPITARRLWDDVTIPSGTWCVAFSVIAAVLGTYNWWRYAGQWPGKGAFNLTSFMQVSTGPDWHIAWALGVSTLQGMTLSISAFALAMYLAYGVGTAITFAYYAFLFNLTSTLAHLASSAGSMASAVLRLYLPDRADGGLSAFRRIQSKHAAFCYVTLFSMYVMALRNAYLPQVCRIPKTLVDRLEDPSFALDYCTTMPQFASTILQSAKLFIDGIFSGRPDFSIVFFTYSEQNDYVMGPMLYGLLIASFFFLISIRMRTIVVRAQSNTSANAGSELLRTMNSENWRVLLVLVSASMATIFLNLGPFVVALAVLLKMVERMLFFRQSMARDAT